MIELKRCPFCGSKGVYNHTSTTNNIMHAGIVECINCKISTPVFSDTGERTYEGFKFEDWRDKAADAWNCRANENISSQSD